MWYYLLGAQSYACTQIETDLNTISDKCYTNGERYNKEFQIIDVLKDSECKQFTRFTGFTKKHLENIFCGKVLDDMNEMVCWN